MNQFSTSKIIRISKATLMLFISCFGLSLTISNLGDYSTNYEYVAHILSMDTIENAARYRYRAITSSMAHHRIYWLIIALEVLFTVFCMLGTYQLMNNINASCKKFHESKRFALIGLMIGLFIYYVLFQVIGVEWFNMDQSPKWNHMEWARHIVEFIVPVMMYVAIRVER